MRLLSKYYKYRVVVLSSPRQPVMALVLIFLLCFALLFGTSCKKYLDKKSLQNLSTPETLKDLQAMLDDEYIYRRGVGLTQTSADEYFLDYSYWELLPDLKRLGYIWDPILDDADDWLQQYANILTANVVLDKLKDIGNGSAQSNSIKGSALFIRSQCFYQLAQIYAPQYDPTSASTDMGIVLRLDADFNKPSLRASVQQTYDQIINDLTEAIELLPATSAANSRPNKVSAYGLLARTFLQIGNYTKAKEAADNSLQLYDYLIDYNDATQVDTLSNQPFLQIGVSNKEIVFYLREDLSVTVNSQTKIDSNLYRSYDPNDIRKAAFFRPLGSGNFRYKGSYAGSIAFVGIGTAEMYLIRAECNARLGSTSLALQDLNKLLKNRFKTGTFVDITAPTSNQALDIILQERKKEMLFRGTRWADLKRLNKEPGRAVSLIRVLNNETFTLSPNDLRYSLLIPLSVIQLTNLQQNPR